VLGRFLQEYWLTLLPCALGAAGVYLLLPQGRRSWVMLGGALAAAALVVVGLYLVRTETIWVETLLFYCFSALAILGGGLLISQSNPVHAALSFALVVLSTCGLFLLQAAPFLMAATIIVYAGAIIVTFLFVIMLAQQAGLSNADRRSREPFLATLAGFIVIAAILCILQKTYDTRQIDSVLQPLLDRTRQATSASTIDELKLVIGDRRKYFEEFRQLLKDETVDNVEEAYVKGDLGTVKKQLSVLYAEGVRLRARQGSLEVDAANVPLSPFTQGRVRAGFPSPLAPLSPRESGRGEGLPANNVMALGRTMFTQYLLAVELAGVLLLVASIGAIAIAARRSEALR